MSLENCGVFQLLKEVTFRRNLELYDARKWIHFHGALSPSYSFRLQCWMLNLLELS